MNHNDIAIREAAVKQLFASSHPPLAKPHRGTRLTQWGQEVVMGRRDPMIAGHGRGAELG